MRHAANPDGVNDLEPAPVRAAVSFFYNFLLPRFHSCHPITQLNPKVILCQLNLYLSSYSSAVLLDRAYYTSFESRKR